MDYGNRSLDYRAAGHWIIGPQVIGLGPQVIELGQQVIGLGPQVIGIGPQVIGIGPQVIGLGPQVFGLGPQVSGLGPQVTGLGPKVIKPEVHEVQEKGRNIRKQVVLNESTMSNHKFFGLQMALACRLDAISQGPKSLEFQGPTPSHLPS